jgi:hypothetical protein
MSRDFAAVVADVSRDFTATVGIFHHLLGNIPAIIWFLHQLVRISAIDQNVTSAAGIVLPLLGMIIYK